MVKNGFSFRSVTLNFDYAFSFTSINITSRFSFSSNFSFISNSSFISNPVSSNKILSYLYKKIAEPLSHRWTSLNLLKNRWTSLKQSLNLFLSDCFNKPVTKPVNCLPVKEKTLIVPVFKIRDNTIVKNYLIICIVSFITKVFERLMWKSFNFFTH